MKTILMSKLPDPLAAEIPEKKAKLNAEGELDIPSTKNLKPEGRTQIPLPRARKRPPAKIFITADTVEALAVKRRAAAALAVEAERRAGFGKRKR
jgi:hypothetical protein